MGVCMGPFSALSALIRRTITLQPKTFYVEALLDFVLGWLLWPLKYLDGIVQRVTDIHFVAGGIYLVAQKIDGQRVDGDE